ncbi:hypothetical protein FORC14_0190 [Vibrio parahaemolyticus]|nr:hypothetical protein FORC14_0190 [Vibrio parahaemolyticus]
MTADPNLSCSFDPDRVNFPIYSRKLPPPVDNSVYINYPQIVQ